jgi:uncharacterized Tic20 family protein
VSETTPPPPAEEPGRTSPPPATPPPPAPPPPPPPAPEGWPSSPPPGAPPPAWSPAGPPSQAAADANARQWAMIAHLSALAGLIIGLNWLGPLIVYLVKKDEHPFIADQSREALNFNLSVFIYIIASAILIILVIGIILLPVVAIAWLVLTIMAAVRSNNGESYRYPLTIRLVT